MAGTLVLISGGLDSVTALYYIKKNYPEDRITALFFDYGQRSAELERKLSKLHAEALNVNFAELNLDLDFTHNRMLKVFKDSSEQSNEMPMRNLIFLAHATAYAKVNDYSEIVLGIIDANTVTEHSYEDTTIDFLIYTQAYLRTLGIGLYTPLSDMNKVDVLQTALDLHVPLTSISSCNEADKGSPCMQCADCLLLLDTIQKLNGEK